MNDIYLSLFTVNSFLSRYHAGISDDAREGGEQLRPLARQLPGGGLGPGHHRAEADRRDLSDSRALLLLLHRHRPVRAVLLPVRDAAQEPQPGRQAILRNQGEATEGSVPSSAFCLVLLLLSLLLLPAGGQYD